MTDQLTFVSGDEPENPRNLAIYQAVTDPQAFGMDDDGTLVAGLRLELVYQDGEDMLAYEFENLGLEATTRVILPADGLHPGALYKPTITNVSRDWETNTIDDWNVELVLYTEAIPEGGDL